MKKISFLLLTFFTIVGLDRLTKFFALQFLSDKEISVFPWCNLLITWNRGVSWSMLSTNSLLGFWLLFAFIVLIIGFFSWYTYKRLQSGLSVVFEVLVLAGAFSNNMIDRLYYGAVIDFIQLYACNYYFPVFNVADISICVGVFGMLLREWWVNRC